MLGRDIICTGIFRSTDVCTDSSIVTLRYTQGPSPGRSLGSREPSGCKHQ